MRRRGFTTILYFMIIFAVTWFLILHVIVHEDKLLGTSWVLVSIDGIEVNNASHPTIQFGVSDVSGSGGCDSYWGSYSNGDGTFKIGYPQITLVYCGDEQVMETERMFVFALGQVNDFRIEDAHLILQYGTNRELVFIASDAFKNPE